MVMGRVVITIDEIIAGRGLLSSKGTTPPSLEVNCGNGIKFGDNEELVVFPEEVAGCGLVAGKGSKVNVDITPDAEKEIKFRVVTNNQFAMDGYSLIFCTTYKNFIVHRNCVGVVIGIEEGETTTEQQPLNINGYGRDNSPAVKQKSINPDKPSFYK